MSTFCNGGLYGPLLGSSYGTTNHANSTNTVVGVEMEAISNLAKSKRQLCALRNQVEDDLNDGLVSPSFQTSLDAMSFFSSLVSSEFIGMGLNYQNTRSTAPINSTSFITNYGVVKDAMLPNLTFTTGGSNLLIYSTVAVVTASAGTISLARLISVSDLTIYSAGTNVLAVLNNLDVHYNNVISTLRADLAKRGKLIEYFLGDMMDVNLQLPLTNGQQLVYDGCQWTNLAPPPLSQQQEILTTLDGPLDFTLTGGAGIYQDLVGVPFTLTLPMTEMGLYIIHWSASISAPVAPGSEIRFRLSTLEVETETIVNVEDPSLPNNDHNKQISLHYHLVNNSSVVGSRIITIQWTSNLAGASLRLNSSIFNYYRVGG